MNGFFATLMKRERDREGRGGGDLIIICSHQLIEFGSIMRGSDDDDDDDVGMSGEKGGRYRFCRL